MKFQNTTHTRTRAKYAEDRDIKGDIAKLLLFALVSAISLVTIACYLIGLIVRYHA